MWPWEIVKLAWAESALRKRGICPRHLKPFIDKKEDIEHRGWYRPLCEDCLREWQQRESEHVAELYRIVREAKS